MLDPDTPKSRWKWSWRQGYGNRGGTKACHRQPPTDGLVDRIELSRDGTQNRDAQVALVSFEHKVVQGRAARPKSSASFKALSGGCSFRGRRRPKRREAPGLVAQPQRRRSCAACSLRPRRAAWRAQPAREHPSRWRAERSPAERAAPSTALESESSEWCRTAKARLAAPHRPSQTLMRSSQKDSATGSRSANANHRPRRIGPSCSHQVWSPNSRAGRRSANWLKRIPLSAKVCQVTSRYRGSKTLLGVRNRPNIRFGTGTHRRTEDG